ncbi:PREDICTED: uncharacterized protein LOC108569476 [Nicrophorus vespilloides]|uniref:Uncharacterized protein LOC108569476 n=1 Tax=Nicrophorus vespilloides TaxID=110193 RepID=A0ABM1NI81_NICVS|nr:PREDICTED: uncharacterized protein LOC108569476 [Nicrophorus vespilloides]
MFRRSFSSTEEFHMCSNMHGVSYIGSSSSSDSGSSSSSESMDELDENYYMNRPPSIFSNNRPINLTLPTNTMFLSATENLSIGSYSSRERYANVLKQHQEDDKSEAEAMSKSKKDTSTKFPNNVLLATENLSIGSNVLKREAEAMSKSKKDMENKTKENVVISENQSSDDWITPKGIKLMKMQSVSENAKNMFSVLLDISTDEEKVEEAVDSGDKKEQHQCSASQETLTKKRNGKRRKKRAERKRAAANVEQDLNVVKHKMKEVKQQSKPNGTRMSNNTERCSKQQPELPQFTDGEVKKLVSTRNVESRGDLQKMTKLYKKIEKKANKFNKKLFKRLKARSYITILLYETPKKTTMKDLVTDGLFDFRCLRRENIYNPYYFDTKFTVCDVNHHF